MTVSVRSRVGWGMSSRRANVLLRGQMHRARTGKTAQPWRNAAPKRASAPHRRSHLTFYNGRFITSREAGNIARPHTRIVTCSVTEIWQDRENSTRLRHSTRLSAASGSAASRRRQCAISRLQWACRRPASTTPSATSGHSSPAPWNIISIIRRGCGFAASKRRSLPNRRFISFSMISSNARSMTGSGRGVFSSIQRSKSRRMTMSSGP